MTVQIWLQLGRRRTLLLEGSDRWSENGKSLEDTAQSDLDPCELQGNRRALELLSDSKRPRIGAHVGFYSSEYR